MGSPIQSLVQQFTDKSSVAECSVDELQQLVSRYPYFAPARFALLKRLHVDGIEADYTKQYQTAILFHPDPLQFNHFIQEFEQSFEDSLLSVDSTPSKQMEKAEERIVAETNDQLSSDGDEFEIGAPSLEIVKTQVAGENLDSVPSSTDNETAQTEALNVEAALNSPVEVSTETSTPEQTKAKPSAELTFEPFHTVDYFASQGIKVTADDLGKDKLGKQLRSFTEWLKTMKRLPSAATPTGATVAEQKVENLADASVSEAEVLTESMAEVWAKQGATEKAAEIYRKLSLLNPDKATYFAAKIQSLKQPS